MKRPSEVIKTIEEMNKSAEFLPTGFSEVDEYLDGGFMRKELIVLGGYAGVGKSYIASQILWVLAQKGYQCAYFSLEISNEMIVSRILGSISNLKPTRIFGKGLFLEEEYQKLDKAKTEIIIHDEFISLYDDLYKLEVIEKEIKEKGYEFVVIDFIQNVMAKGNEEYDRLSNVALELQRLAKEVNCCILTLSQLSNEAARRGLMEFKGSGTIITVCDIGMFIKRSEVSLGENNNLFEISIKKNRRGFTCPPFSFEFEHPGGKIVCKGKQSTF